MKHRNPTLSFYLLVSIPVLLSVGIFGRRAAGDLPDARATRER